MRAMLSPKAIDKFLASNLAAMEAGYGWAKSLREQSAGRTIPENESNRKGN
jgi:hypothetical protein